MMKKYIEMFERFIAAQGLSHFDQAHLVGWIDWEVYQREHDNPEWDGWRNSGTVRILHTGKLVKHLEREGRIVLLREDLITIYWGVTIFNREFPDCYPNDN